MKDDSDSQNQLTADRAQCGSGWCDDQAAFGCQARDAPRFLWRLNQRPDNAEKLIKVCAKINLWSSPRPHCYSGQESKKHKSQAKIGRSIKKSLPSRGRGSRRHDLLSAN